ncbi:MAG: endonuclease III, partial [Candidatus Micrarchaeaceae archaeon]
MNERNKSKFARKVLRLLAAKYGPVSGAAPHRFTPWQLLVATILSAQATDKSVEKATAELFRHYKSIESFSRLRPAQLYKYTKSIGLYRAKSSNIIKAAKMLRESYGSKVPASMEQLVRLPGVGRKTANIVLSNAFGISEGIAIDTHCITVSNRLKLVHTKDPKKIEQELMHMLPKSEWGSVNYLFIELGRDTCTAKEKHCERCA